MTKEEWNQVQESMSHAYGSATLSIDGYELHLSVQRSKGLKYDILVYVNGWMRGTWVSEDCEERRRFMRPVTKYFYDASFREELGAFSKKRLAAMKCDPYKKIVYYVPYWPSFGPLKAHLIKNNTSIEWAKEEKRCGDTTETV